MAVAKDKGGRRIDIFPAGNQPRLFFFLWHQTELVSYPAASHDSLHVMVLAPTSAYTADVRVALFSR